MHPVPLAAIAVVPPATLVFTAATEDQGLQATREMPVLQMVRMAALSLPSVPLARLGEWVTHTLPVLVWHLIPT